MTTDQTENDQKSRDSKMSAGSQTSLSPRKATLRYAILVVLSLIGVGLSTILTHHFYEVHAGTAGFKSFCNISSTFNCDAVAASPYAELFAGIPLSSFAIGWFLGIFALSLLAMGSTSRRVINQALLAMTGIGVLFSLAYLFIMIGVVHFYCVFCLGVDLMNILALGVALSLRQGTDIGRAKDETGTSWGTIGAIVAGCLFVSVVGAKGMDQTHYKSSDIKARTEEILNSPQFPVNSDPSHPSFGPQNAPVTVVEFSDFECPYCRMGAMNLNTVLHRYPKTVRVVFRNFPLDPKCNRMMQHQGHEFACELARIGYCANQQGKFDAFYQEDFQNQGELAPGVPMKFAKKAGLDQQKLEACLKSPATENAVQSDIEEGIRLNVESTPTFFVNGRKVEGAQPLPVWDQIIHQLTTQVE